MKGIGTASRADDPMSQICLSQNVSLRCIRKDNLMLLGYFIEPSADTFRGFLKFSESMFQKNLNEFPLDEKLPKRQAGVGEFDIFTAANNLSIHINVKFFHQGLPLFSFQGNWLLIL
jgi:hypothetical protein